MKLPVPLLMGHKEGGFYGLGLEAQPGGLKGLLAAKDSTIGLRGLGCWSLGFQGFQSFGFRGPLAAENSA